MEKQGTLITEPLLFFTDARGTYIPKDFAEFLNGNEKVEHNIAQEDIEVLLNPDNEFYWDVWEGVLESKFKVKDTGQVLELYQDGDLWVLPEGFGNKIYRANETSSGSLELWCFWGDAPEAVIDSVEELEEYQDRFASQDDYQIAVELLSDKEQ